MNIVLKCEFLSVFWMCVQINTENGAIERVIASDPKADFMGFRGDPSKVLFMDFKTKEFLAVGFIYDKLKWTVLDKR